MEIIGRNKRVLISICPETSNYGKHSAFTICKFFHGDPLHPTTSLTVDSENRGAAKRRKNLYFQLKNRIFLGPCVEWKLFVPFNKLS